MILVLGVVTVPGKERKVICPRCHRNIPEGELAQHISQHKGKIPPHLRAQVSRLRIASLPYACDCGLRFAKRKEIRTHLKECKQAVERGQYCSDCSVMSEVLLPYEDLALCPTCATKHFETKAILDCPVINHMGPEYEKIFSEKMEVLMPRLGVEKLPDLGVNVTVITFSQGQDAFRYSISPRGELIFIFARSAQVREREKRAFELTINHEVFHAYIEHRLKLSISEKIKGPFTFMEGSAVQLAEDIQLNKIAVRENLQPLIADEVSRTTSYYENSSPMPMNRWATLPDYAKLLASISLAWTYAVEAWYVQVLRELEARKQAEENMKLVHPHFSTYGFPKLRDLILQLLNEKTAETAKESEGMAERLLSSFDEYADIHNLIIY